MVTIILAILMLVLVAIGVVASIFMIGKPRVPTTPGAAIIGLIVAGIQAYLFIWVITHA